MFYFVRRKKTFSSLHIGLDFNNTYEKSLLRYREPTDLYWFE